MSTRQCLTKILGKREAIAMLEKQADLFLFPFFWRFSNFVQRQKKIMLKESSRSISQQTKNVSKSPGLPQGKHHPRLSRELILGTWIPSAFASQAELDLVLKQRRA